MRKYLLLTGAALIGFSGAAYAAINCAVPPTCDELGYAYTADQCEDQAMLKCPFDQEKVFCGEPLVSAICTVGAILYNDLKCYDETPEGKTAIGIVFDPNKRLAVSLSTGLVSVQWGSYGTDISTLANCTTSNYATCDTDGKSNTQKIIAVQGESTSLAAGSCYFSTYGGLATGSWFLPSASDLKTLYDNKTMVNTSITTVGAASTLNDQFFRSSNESNSTYALGMSMDKGSISGSPKSNSCNRCYARCVVAY